MLQIQREKKCRKSPNSKCKMNPPCKKCKTKLQKKNKNKQTFPNPYQGRTLMKLSPIGILLEDVTDQQIIGIIDDNMVEIPKHWDRMGIIWA